MMRLFDHPWLLLAVPLLDALVLLALLGAHRRRRARLARFGTDAALARLAPAGMERPPYARARRLVLAMTLTVAAIAAPRWGEGSARMSSDGIDVVLAMDASLSMLAEDERPSRLERMKQEIRRFRAAAPGDRVALLAFAGRSYILAPLTSDDGAIELFLENLDPTVVGQVGSAIAPPLRQGIDLLSAARGGADRALILLTDGEAFDDAEAAVRIATEAREKEILLVTVGFGTLGGGPIPLPETGGTDVKRDEHGEIVITKYDDTLLRRLADAAGGAFIGAEENDKGTRMRQAISQLEGKRRAEEQRLARPLRYQWFLLPAILLFLFDAWRVEGGRFRAPWRRRARLASLLFLAAIPIPLQAQSPALRTATREHQAGRPLAAIPSYRRAVADGDRRPIVLYNLGTALLAVDSLDAAVEMLERSAFTPDAALRARALYNLGLAQLKRARRLEGDARAGPLRAARRAFRTVLLQTPGDRDAQWNYELALQQQPPQSGEGGGGGGGGNAPTPPPRPEPQPQQKMSRQQAEALLEAAARDERETQAKRQRGARPDRAAGVRDW